MKTLTLFVLALLVFPLTSPSALAGHKLCVGLKGEFKGFELRLIPSNAEITLRPMPSNRGYQAFTGTYASNHSIRLTLERHVQLGFDGEEEGAFNIFWLDERLFEPGGAGHLEVTSHDEGELTARFACKEFP